MATKMLGTCPAWRLRTGESVLSAAREIDTSVVKARLARFERAHRAYVDAHRRVDLADVQLTAAEVRLQNCDALQDKALGVLARALIHDGQPIGNAFAPFGVPPLGKLTRLPFAEEAATIHQLVAAVLREDDLAKDTIQAAQAADQAARAVELALVPLTKMQQGVREARRRRDARGQSWDNALASLKNDARAASRDGTPHVYATLFPPSRVVPKSKAVAATPPGATDNPPTPAPVASATATPNAA
jgi:hypothetical protein